MSSRVYLKHSGRTEGSSAKPAAFPVWLSDWLVGRAALELWLTNQGWSFNFDDKRWTSNADGAERAHQRTQLVQLKCYETSQIMKSTPSIFSQLRCLASPSAAPRCARRSLGYRLNYSTTTTKKATPTKIHVVPKKAKPVIAKPAPKYTSSSPWNPTTAQRAAPENVLVYHAGTGRIVFLGMLRTATIFVCGVSTLIIAPAFYGDEFPWYLAPLIVVGGALPLAFVSYTTAPFVNNIYLHLPIFARKSREAALEYVKNLPPSATLSIRTMKITTIPRTTQVRVSDLVSDKAILRPVSFRNRKPGSIPWWSPRTLKQFYTLSASKDARSTPKFYPELWEHIFRRIQSQRP